VVWGGLILIAFASVAAAEEGWSLSKLNPFKKSPPSRRAKAKVSDDSSSWKWPKMSLPSWGSKPKPPQRRQEPSTISKVSKSTKELAAKTKATLMPWSNDSKQAPTRSSSYSKSGKKSTFAPWFPKKENEAKKPTQTMSDFLGAERPESDY
jgi:hypothetical protein